ncbi:MAG TPA: zinc ribbon domain-containing protein [Ktedonobacterales bacterium]|nr:zinc ribbon domain-containing protein [Ktedonobacterales bacterium]
MSFYSADQRCPRCQYPNPPGTLTCGNCGLALSSAPQTSYGSDPYSPPPPPPAPPGSASSPYGPPPGSGAYGSSGSYSGTGGYSGSPRYDFTAQPPPPYTGSSSYYAGSQPQPGTAPAYAGSQPPFPPPGSSQPPTQQSRGGVRVGLIVLVVVIIVALAGGGVAVFLLSKPKPTINVTSQYQAGAIPAGAASTKLQVTGQHFSSNSAITFLLDEQIAPDSQTAQSDGGGNVTATLTVSAKWAVGQHTLTAKDGSNNTTQTGAQIDVVNPGEAGTPGPNGAPTDGSDLNIVVKVTRQDATTGESLGTFNLTLSVHGTAAANQQVCWAANDDGQPHTYTGSDNIGNYQEVFVWKCTGSYKAGKLSYTETTTSDTLTYTSGRVCKANTPYVYTQLDGTFSSATAISGTYSADTIQYTCNKDGNLHTNAEKGTWSGSTS